MDKELMCAICLEFFDEPLMLPCSHNFCRKCLQGIITARDQFTSYRPQRYVDCPLCQRKIPLERTGVDQFPVNRALGNVISVYKAEAEVTFNDASWSKDVSDSAGQCRLHKEDLCFYCLSCNQAVCKECKCISQRDAGASHRFSPIKEQLHRSQTSILASLSEIRKKSVMLNDRIQLLNEILEGIDENEKHVQKSIEEEFEALRSQLKSRQEEMKRRLHNDIEAIKRPILDQLRKNKSINSSIDDHQRKLSLVKATQDPSLRIKLLQESERQLNSLLCFDLAWFSSSDTPTVNMPTWELQKRAVENAIPHIQLKRSGHELLTPDSAASTEAGITAGLSGVSFSDKNPKHSHEMAKQPVRDDPASYLRSSSSTTLGVQTEPISNTSTEGAVMHRNALSIHKHPLPLDPNRPTENKDVRTTTSLYFTSQSGKPQGQQRTNMSVTLPPRSDIEISSHTSNVHPRLSLPTTASTIAISLRRNSEGGLQTLGGGEAGTPTSATLPITTPITNSLLANINSVPPITSSSVSLTSEAGAASFPSFTEPDRVPSSMETENGVNASSPNGSEGSNRSNNQTNNFSDANLPRITARDFSPGRGVTYPGGRRIVKAKKIIKK
ncbi:uncharacterized protein LOC133173040 [Saccostrea echinata]|uniref:uncharacterized protein LOC133173040 n=1 Tax=Saccostrea echinata TaxID=191078 RepID=UPI002A82173B|nr:uncharacterized protein LOC133173040 [Saccostrea echinata]